MTRWKHSKKQVREVLDDAADAGLVVEVSKSGGHGWGEVRCPPCAQQVPVWSTPKNADNHVKRIRRFIKQHQHEGEEE